MQATLAPRGDAQTILTHFVGGLDDDDRNVVERSRSMADGNIVPVLPEAVKAKGRRKARGSILTAQAVEKMRPARDEIIIATGVKRRGSGLQLWGWRAMGIFVDCRQRG